MLNAAQSMLDKCVIAGKAADIKQCSAEVQWMLVDHTARLLKA